MFTYNSAALHLLSVILMQSTGIRTQNFALRFLFNSLNIEKHTWETDHQGFINGAAGLNLTPHDMVKIGELILNRGLYNNKRIVSSQWIDKVASFHLSTNNAISFGMGYGYCWWTGNTESASYVFANGYGGQFIVVVPALSLVITATNSWQGITGTAANDQWYRTLNLVISIIIPAFYKG